MVSLPFQKARSHVGQDVSRILRQSKVKCDFMYLTCPYLINLDQDGAACGYISAIVLLASAKLKDKFVPGRAPVLASALRLILVFTYALYAILKLSITIPIRL